MEEFTREIIEESCFDYFIKNVQDASGKPLITFRDDTVTGSEFLSCICSMAEDLRNRGVRKGSRVALMLPNVPVHAVAFYALFALGAVVVPVNILMQSKDLALLLKEAGALHIIYWDLFAPLVRDAVKGGSLQITEIVLTEPLAKRTFRGTSASFPQNARNLKGPGLDDAAVIQFSSGTTGPMRGVIWTHRNISFVAQLCGEIFNLTRDDSILGALPLFHPFGQMAILHMAIWNGCAIEFHERFEPLKILDSIRTGRVSVLVGVPAMYLLLSRTAEDKPERHKNFRFCISGGGYMPPERLEGFEAKFGIPLLETYGTTESLFFASANYLNGPRKAGSTGYPLPEVEMKIVDEYGKTLSAPDEGEITISGRNIAPGYCKDPGRSDVSIRNGWLHTGDIGYMDEEGFFHFLDRKEDVIEKGGFHVYPREVEDVIMKHGEVAETAVIGISDPQRGEEVKGCVVLKEGSFLSERDIIARCREKLPFYKCPKEIAFYKELPKGPSGRILKRVLRTAERESDNSRETGEPASQHGA